MSKVDYSKALRKLAPLKIIEMSLLDMMEKDEDNPEFIPKHYAFICSVIDLLEDLKKDMQEAMSQS
tara:strand:- start:7 stop:204 length:198 start_codon:yes stop_codon:yes gene_type:complete